MSYSMLMSRGRCWLPRLQPLLQLPLLCSRRRPVQMLLRKTRHRWTLMAFSLLHGVTEQESDSDNVTSRSSSNSKSGGSSKNNHGSNTSSSSNKKLRLDVGRVIPDALMQRHVHDVTKCRRLLERTLHCSQCNKRLVVEKKLEKVEYCECKGNANQALGVQGVKWTPFLEKEDIVVWRQEHPDNPGTYAYKMYGKFDDVSCSEFVHVMLDVSAFRHSWDTTTAQCHLIDEDEEGEELRQLYYWETNWPTFFNNRDYVCYRRFNIFNNQESIKERDKENCQSLESDNSVAVIYSRSGEHDSYPKKAKNFRVEEYWSVLTVRPLKSFDDRGIEFSLTAYENPGLQLPSSIVSWVAMRAMPEHMKSAREACIKIRTWRPTRRVAKGDKEPSFMRSTFSNGNMFIDDDEPGMQRRKQVAS